LTVSASSIPDETIRACAAIGYTLVGIQRYLIGSGISLCTYGPDGQPVLAEAARSGWRA